MSLCDQNGSGEEGIQPGAQSKKILPCGRFSTLCAAGAMFFASKNREAGVAQFPSDGEEICVPAQFYFVRRRRYIFVWLGMAPAPFL